MIRRPPRSTLTHAFPTRRSSDLQQLVLFRRHRAEPPVQVLVDLASRMLAAGGQRRFDVFVGVIDDIAVDLFQQPCDLRSEEHTSELQSLMRSSYAVFCLQKKKRRI